MKQEVCIVWLKRDLRTRDHAAFFQARKTKLPVIALYCFEPTLSHQTDWDERHWRFVYQSITDLNKKNHITWAHEEVIDVLQEINNHFTIKFMHSHQESGTEFTYQRDKGVARWCRKNNVTWKQHQSNGVVRNLKDKKQWERLWTSFMKRDLLETDLSKLNFADTSILQLSQELSQSIVTDHNSFPIGGEDKALSLMNEFFNSFDFEKGTYTTSELSPYISWGNISLRQVYQESTKLIPKYAEKKKILQFTNRLKWHCFFSQQFEEDTSLEFPGDGRKLDKDLFHAWKTGMTGYPLIDAAMRCVNQTGHINYRMRSMVVAFLSTHLKQPWGEGAKYLAKQFIDYDPAIHYPQFHLQSEALHNPIKQSQDKDKDAEFIRKWVPELRETPLKLIHRPWEIGSETYPFPVVKLWKEVSKF